MRPMFLCGLVGCAIFSLAPMSASAAESKSAPAAPAAAVPAPAVQPVDVTHVNDGSSFDAVTLPAQGAGKKLEVNFVPYVSFFLDFVQNLSGQNRNQSDVKIGNYDPNTGIVTATQPRGQFDTNFGVDRMLLGVQMQYDERWSGGVELQATDTPRIGGTTTSGGSSVDLSLAYLRVDLGAGFYNHSLAFGRIPTLYVNYFDDVLWGHRFVAPGFMERNGLEFRTDDGVRVDGFNAEQTWLWSAAVTNGAPIGNEAQFDGMKGFSAMVIGQPFIDEPDAFLPGLKVVAELSLLDRASVGNNPRISSAKRHLLLGLFYIQPRYHFGLELIPWGTQGRDARKPTSTRDGNVFGLSVWSVFLPQPDWDVYLRLDVWDPNTQSNREDATFVGGTSVTQTAPGQESYYVLMGASKHFNSMVQGSLNLEVSDDDGKLQFSAGGAQVATASRVDVSVRFAVTM
ncbi:MAG: hypothetical protein ACREJ2_07315 [Planctomycetota bacterium]